MVDTPCGPAYGQQAPPSALQTIVLLHTGSVSGPAMTCRTFFLVWHIGKGSRSCRVSGKCCVWAAPEQT